MQILDYMEAHGHEQLAVWSDPSAGLRAFVAIHDTTLGPSLGGTRIWPYATEDEALLDVLRLAQAMTYKSAAAGLPLGGGKGLIIADSRTQKTEAMFRSYGRFVDSLGGRYITTEDVGATPQDIEWASRETRHVVGLSKEIGGSGNPSQMTGYGIFQGMRAAARHVWGSDSLEGRTVAVQGFGNVATSLSAHLLEAGARLIVTDIDETKRARAAELDGVTVVAPDAILAHECDVLAPCALGGILHAETIAALRCSIVCGGANNQLREDADALRLKERGILYAPDYIVNAGGVINVSFELAPGGYNADAAREKTSHIYDTMQQVIATADQQDVTTAEAADMLARSRLEEARRARDSGA